VWCRLSAHVFMAVPKHVVFCVLFDFLLACPYLEPVTLLLRVVLPHSPLTYPFLHVLPSLSVVHWRYSGIRNNTLTSSTVNIARFRA
jgi:hypothetical protein